MNNPEGSLEHSQMPPGVNAPVGAGTLPTLGARGVNAPVRALEHSPYYKVWFGNFKKRMLYVWLIRPHFPIPCVAAVLERDARAKTSAAMADKLTRVLRHCAAPAPPKAH